MNTVKLLVAALDSELVAFPENLPGFERLVTGPGKLKATYALTRALDAASYDEILVVGTAGALDETIASGVHEVHWTFQHDVINEEGVRGEHVSMPQRMTLGDGDIAIACATLAGFAWVIRAPARASASTASA